MRSILRAPPLFVMCILYFVPYLRIRSLQMNVRIHVCLEISIIQATLPYSSCTNTVKRKINCKKAQRAKYFIIKKGRKSAVLTLMSTVRSFASIKFASNSIGALCPCRTQSSFYTIAFHFSVFEHDLPVSISFAFTLTRLSVRICRHRPCVCHQRCSINEVGFNAVCHEFIFFRLIFCHSINWDNLQRNDPHGREYVCWSDRGMKRWEEKNKWNFSPRHRIECIFQECMSQTMLISQLMWNRFKCLMQTQWRRASIARITCSLIHLCTHKNSPILPHAEYLLFSYSFMECQKENENSHRKYASLLFPVTRHLCTIQSIPFHSQSRHFLHWANGTSASSATEFVCFYYSCSNNRHPSDDCQSWTETNQRQKKQSLRSKNQDIMVSKVFYRSCI